MKLSNDTYHLELDFTIDLLVRYSITDDMDEICLKFSTGKTPSFVFLLSDINKPVQSYPISYVDFRGPFMSGEETPVEFYFHYPSDSDLLWLSENLQLFNKNNIDIHNHQFAMGFYGTINIAKIIKKILRKSKLKLLNEKN